MAVNKYITPIQNTLEQYVPLPFDEMLKAGQLIQQRGDLAEQQQAQTQAGLASMEALAPGYSQFRDQFATDYKSQAGNLLDKYQGNTSNPEFIRDIKRLNLQYASDPRLQTIKQGNELVRQNQQIATKMQAEGKLFINPQFTGLDQKGNITAAVPGVEGVNTLEDWTNRFKIAHESMEDIGTKTTNKRNLDRTRALILNDIKTGGPESSKLMKAYQQQGLSPEAARQAVINNVSGLANQYGRVEKTNTALLNYGLNERQFAYQKSQDANRLDLERYKAETARQKVAAAGKTDQAVNTPSFTEFANKIGSIGTINASGKKDGESYLFGSGFSQYGASNVPVKNAKITGKIYDISEGQRKATSKTVDITDGTLKGYMNAWVNSKTGEILQTHTATSKPRIEYINGKPFAFKAGKPYPIEQRTVAEYNYNAGTKDKPELKTIYKEAAPKEAMEQMGYSNAYYEGMGRTQHGNIFDSNNKVRLDEKFIQSNPELRGDLPLFKDAQEKANKGTATETDIQLLNLLQSYDSRRSTYMNEILPRYQNQGKTKSIVTEE